MARPVSRLFHKKIIGSAHLKICICHQKFIEPTHNRNYQVMIVTFRYHLDCNFFVFLIFNKLGNKLDAHAWMQRVIPGCNFVVEMWFSNFGRRHDKWYTYLKYCSMTFGHNILGLYLDKYRFISKTINAPLKYFKYFIWQYKCVYLSKIANELYISHHAIFFLTVLKGAFYIVKNVLDM